jgi:hypothetical protein
MLLFPLYDEMLQLHSMTVSCLRLTAFHQTYITTDVQSVSESCCQAPISDLRPDSFFCLTVTGLLLWEALSDERTGLFFFFTMYGLTKTKLRCLSPQANYTDRATTACQRS